MLVYGGISYAKEPFQVCCARSVTAHRRGCFVFLCVIGYLWAHLCVHQELNNFARSMQDLWEYSTAQNAWTLLSMGEGTCLFSYAIDSHQSQLFSPAVGSVRPSRSMFSHCCGVHWPRGCNRLSHTKGARKPPAQD